MQTKQSRYWCFTLNNPQQQLFLDGNDQPSFAIWQYERGASGTHHFQGYVEYAAIRRRAQVARHIGGGCHLESRRGTQLEAISYCRKAESRVDGPWRLGAPTTDVQGANTGLKLFVQRLKDGEVLSQVAIEDGATYVRNCRGLAALADLFFSPSFRSVSCYYLYGATGCGKSSLVYDAFGYANVYALADKDPVWFDGYRGQDVLLIDEYQGLPREEALLRCLDGHPYSARYKGGFVNARWSVVVLCSNYDLFNNFTPELRRRFDRGGFFRLVGQRGGYGELAGKLITSLGKPERIPKGGLYGEQQQLVGGGTTEAQEVPSANALVPCEAQIGVPVGACYWSHVGWSLPNQ